MKILAVGNSFSTDASRWFHDTCAELGADVTIVNLYIGGCSLETHFLNIEEDAPAYEYQVNGQFDGRMASIREALEEGGWDAILTQQCSHDSGWIETYEPFLGEVVAYFRRYAPEAKLYLHETWAYEHGAPHKNFPRYRRNQQEMYERLRRNYYAMAEKYGLALIPSGDIIQSVRALPPFDVQNGGRSLCRDGFHMSHCYGRYLLALVWAKYIVGLDVSASRFTPVHEDEPTEEALLQLIRDTVSAH